MIPEMASAYQVAFAQGWGYGYERALKEERERCKFGSKRDLTLTQRIYEANAAQDLGRFLYDVARLED